MDNLLRVGKGSRVGFTVWTDKTFLATGSRKIKMREQLRGIGIIESLEKDKALISIEHLETNNYCILPGYERVTISWEDCRVKMMYVFSMMLDLSKPFVMVTKETSIEPKTLVILRKVAKNLLSNIIGEWEAELQKIEEILKTRGTRDVSKGR